MKPISVNFTNQTIVMTKAFADKASNPKTAEHKQLAELKKSFPTYTEVRHTIKKTKKESYKGLNYDFMFDYINRYVEESKKEKAIKDLEDQIYLTKCHTAKFPTVRKWFLATYSEINTNYGKLAKEFEERNAIAIISNSETEEDLCA